MDILNQRGISILTLIPNFWSISYSYKTRNNLINKTNSSSHVKLDCKYLVTNYWTLQKKKNERLKKFILAIYWHFSLYFPFYIRYQFPAPKISNFINVYLYSEGRHENLKFSPLEGHDSPIRNVSQHDNQTDEHILWLCPVNIVTQTSNSNTSTNKKRAYILLNIRVRYYL